MLRTNKQNRYKDKQKDLKVAPMPTDIVGVGDYMYVTRLNSQANRSALERYELICTHIHLYPTNLYS